jgi:HlyD family secretion protein
MTLINLRTKGSAVYAKATVAAAALAAVLSIGWIYLKSAHPIEQSLPQIDPTPRTYRVGATTVESSLDAVGNIQPASVTLIVAPFEGYVKRRYAEDGAIVHAGDAVVEMETAELDMQLRETEANLLKAEMAAGKLAHWEEEAEVLTAKRAVAAAEAQIAKDVQVEKDTKMLFDKGIISRNEFNASHEQAESHKGTLVSAQQKLMDTLQQGDAQNRRVADLALQSARAKMDELKGEAQGTIVRASLDGLLLQPPAAASPNNGSAGKAIVAPGVHVTRGQALFSLANISNYVAEAKIDEVDIDKVQIGQPVEITSDSFPGAPIQGKIISIGMEAEDVANMNATARFVIRTLFSVEDDRRAKIRVGMSARLTIVTYSNRNATLVPHSAIVMHAGQSFVTEIDAETGAKKEVAVELGVSMAKGVEIRNGLTPGSLISLQ